MDAALPLPVSLRDDAARRAEAATAPPRPRPRGPVLIGDLSAAWGGRPLFLTHWSEDDPR